jgi:signal transduction histidine kinase
MLLAGNLHYGKREDMIRNAGHFNPSGVYMPVHITCPNCGRKIGSDEKTCPNCGIDLALAIIWVEHTLNVVDETSDSPISPEILVPRLGEHLLGKGFLTQEQLDKALEEQRKAADQGKPCRLGQTLLQLGFIERENLDQAITEQILRLQAALQQSNRMLEQRVQERTNELQNALTKLTELNQLKSNFISSISHELRTPLTHIKGYLDLLNEGDLGEINESQRRALNVMLKAEAKLEQLIEDLIRFSLAAKGELTLNLNWLDVNQLFEIVRNRCGSSARDKEIQLHFHPETGLSPARADEEKILWVLSQLVENAIKFTPPRGQVVVKAGSLGELILFQIEDTGIGIPEERIGEIFEPFHQLDSSDNRRYGGTGLGLALVQRIVEAHGSQIKVTSVEGQGSTFEFFLPVYKDGYGRG